MFIAEARRTGEPRSNQGGIHMDVVASAQPSTGGQSHIPLVPACRLHDVVQLIEIQNLARALGLPGWVAVHFIVRAAVDRPGKRRVFRPGLCTLERAVDVDLELIVPEKSVSLHVTCK